MPKIIQPYAVASAGKTKHLIMKRRVGSKDRFDVVASVGSPDIAERTAELLNKGHLAEMAEPDPAANKPAIPMPRLGSKEYLKTNGNAQQVK
jgi:hypothetical protein